MSRSGPDVDKNKRPLLVTFQKIGQSQIGYISVAEGQDLPFPIKRVYWTYFTPEDVERGGHSHKELEQILLAVAGQVTVKTETLDGTKNRFVLDSPAKGLYIPKLCWREMKYTHNAVQVCLASLEYSEEDYIRDYERFLELRLTLK